jgi:hypothetical protein
VKLQKGGGLRLFSREEERERERKGLVGEEANKGQVSAANLSKLIDRRLNLGEKRKPKHGQLN